MEYSACTYMYIHSLHISFHYILFYWPSKSALIPRKMWKVDFHCPRCMDSLRSKGLYNCARLVLDLKEYYYLAGEYMECCTCQGTFIAWDHRMLGQLTHGVRARLPAVLTYKYACDKSLLCILYGRTLGNSPTAVQHAVQEVHSTEWMDRHIQFLSDCQRYSTGLQSLGLAVPTYDRPSSLCSLPMQQWFLAVYVHDVWSRLPTLHAAATSIHEFNLKIDSTKKVSKKLRGTASWATNVGNERDKMTCLIPCTIELLYSLVRMTSGHDGGTLPFIYLLLC